MSNPEHAGKLPSAPSAEVPLPPRTLPISTSPISPADAVFPDVDGYEINTWLGSGGMGAVWRATQLSTRREVALKLLHLGSASIPIARLRFEREVELASRLSHPNIAAIFDGGIHHGIYFYAMELVDGLPLDQYVHSHNLSINEIVKLFYTICLAVQHAHQRGVIHRDIKPSNILVDREGQPHVLDFGLAKAIESTADSALISVHGEVSGTPAYMSPEQSAGRVNAIDTRSDVYSLGVVLYQSLTGQLPWPIDRPGSISDDARQVIPRPRHARADIDADLEALLVTAMAYEQDDRYSSAADMAADLHRYLIGTPLNARPVTLAYVTRKWLQRNRRAVALTVSIAAAFILVFLWNWREVTSARTATDSASKDEQAERRSAQLSTARELIRHGDDLAAAGRWIEAKASYCRAADLNEIQGISHLADSSGWLDSSNIAPEPLVKWNTTATAVTAWLDDSATMVSVVLSDGTIQRMELPHLQVTTTRPTDLTSEKLLGGYFCAGGSVIDARHDRNDHMTIRIARGANADSLEVPFDGLMKIAPVANVAADFIVFSGNLQKASVMDPVLLAYSTRTGSFTEFERFPDTNLNALAITDSGDRVLTGGANNLTMWDGVTRRRIRKLVYPEGVISAVALSQQGRLAVSGDEAGRVTAWDANDFHPLGKTNVRANGVVGAAISPSENFALTAHSSGEVRLWSLPDLNLLRIFPAQVSNSTGFRFSRDETLVATAGVDGVCLWPVSAAAGGPISLPAPAAAFALNPSGGLLAVGLTDGGVALVDPFLDARLLGLVATDSGNNLVQSIAFTNSGASLMWTDGITSLRSWPTARGQVDRAPMTHDWHLAVGQNQSLALASSPSDGLWLVNTPDARPATHLDSHFVRQFDFSPDGLAIYAIDASGNIQLYDRQTTRRRALIPRKGHPFPQCVTISSDWNTVLIGCVDGTAMSIDLRSPLAPILPFPVHGGPIRKIQFARDDTTVISSGEDGTVRIWDITTRSEIRRHVSGAAGTSYPFFLSSDERFLVLTEDNGRVLRIYDLPRMQRISKLSAPPGNNFSSESSLGNWFAQAGESGWAISCLDRARQLGYSYDSAALARCYWRMDMPAAAKDEFRRLGSATSDPTIKYEASAWEHWLDAHPTDKVMR